MYEFLHLAARDWSPGDVLLASSLARRNHAPAAPLVVPTDGPSNVRFPDCNECFASLTIPAASHLYLCQDEGGNPLDEIGGIMLTANASPTYQQTVAGYTRKGIGFTQVAAQRVAAPATFGPNPATTSVAWIGYFRLGTVSATRRIFGANISSGAGVAAVNVATTGVLQLASPGSTANGAIDHRGAVCAIMQTYDRTATQHRCRSNLDRTGILGTWSAAATDGQKGIGTDGSTSFVGECLWLAAWAGANAEAVASLGSVIIDRLGWP